MAITDWAFSRTGWQLSTANYVDAPTSLNFYASGQPLYAAYKGKPQLYDGQIDGWFWGSGSFALLSSISPFTLLWWLSSYSGGAAWNHFIARWWQGYDPLMQPKTCSQQGKYNLGVLTWQAIEYHNPLTSGYAYVAVSLPVGAQYYADLDLIYKKKGT